MANPIEPTVLDAWPLTSEAKLYRFDVTDSDDNIPSLPVGGYKIVLRSSSTDGCVIRFDAAASAPADKASLTGAAVLLPGVYVPLYIRETTTLHALMIASSATGTLWIEKVR